MVYEWDACSDSLSGMANAVTRYWSYPKKAFQWYKSAEIHTKQKFGLPKWLLAFPVGIALAVVAVPRTYTTLSQGMAGKGLGTAQQNASGPVTSAATAAQLPLAQQVAGYYMQGAYCFSISKGGVVVSEPPQCRENTK